MDVGAGSHPATGAQHPEGTVSLDDAAFAKLVKFLRDSEKDRKRNFLESRIGGIALILVEVVAFSIAGMVAWGLRTKADAIDDGIVGVHTRVDKVDSKLERMQTSFDELRQDLAVTDQSVSTLRAETNGSIAGLRDGVSEVKAEMRGINEDIRALRDADPGNVLLDRLKRTEARLDRLEELRMRALEAQIEKSGGSGEERR